MNVLASDRPHGPARGPVVILFNPVAGAGRASASAAALDEALRARGYATRCAETQRGDIRAWLAEDLSGAQALVVLGGDGAVRLAAPAAIAASVPLCHVPLGTENLFARQFGGGATAESVVRSIESAHVVPMDVGIVNGSCFLLMMSAGFDAEVVHDLTAHRSGPISHVSYMRPIIRQLVAWRAASLTIEASDGSRLAVRERGALIVANSRQYALRLDPIPEADPSDGMLDVLFIPVRAAPAYLARMLARSVIRRVGSRGVRAFRTSGFRFWGDPPVRLQVDGDALALPPASKEHPAEVTLLPAALQVLTSGDRTEANHACAEASDSA